MTKIPDTNERAAAMADRPHPNDFWIVSTYHYKPWPTLEQAMEARDVLFQKFPKKSFHLIHCKQRLTPSRSGRLIALLITALELARTDLIRLNGAEDSPVMSQIDAALGEVRT